MPPTLILVLALIFLTVSWAAKRNLTTSLILRIVILWFAICLPQS
jgi:hypothetical protein